MQEPIRLVRQDYMAPTASVRVFRHVLHGSSCLHWHDFYEVFFILSGSGWHFLNGKRFRLQAGSLFLLTPTDFHELIPLGSPLELFNLIFSEESIPQALYNRLFADLSCEKEDIFSDKSLLWLQSEFEHMWQEYNQQATGYQLVLEARLNCILVELVRKIEAHIVQKSATTNTSPAVQRALIYIHTHFREELSLKEVAKQAQLAPNYFSEIFHKTTGIPFQTYLQELRIQFALALLRASDLSITEICYASGFKTLSHFLRVFKQKFHQSPGVFRQLDQ